MKLTDLIHLIWNNMWRRKARTILTMIGVIIGSVSIFVLVSIGSGFQKFVMTNMSAISDANTINVIPNTLGIPTDTGSQDKDSTKKSSKKDKKILDDSVLKDLKILPGVKDCIANYSVSDYSLEYKKNKSYASILGISMKEYSKGHSVQYGKIPSDNGDECIIDKTLASTLLKQDNSSSVSDDDLKGLINKKITLTVSRNNDDGQEETKVYPIKVTGISSGSYSDYLSLKLSLNSLKKMEEWKNGGKDVIKTKGYSQIDVVVENSKAMDNVKKRIKEMGFIASSFEEITKGFNSVLNGVKLVVGAIGAISLLVAAFGIANTMNMSIYERKKEIGIMKVVGASLWNVKAIFIGEASAIGLAGGLIGIGIGFSINSVINLFINAYFAKQGAGTVKNMIGTDLGLTMFVLLFATLVGFLSGLYPASKAAGLDVISSVKED